MATKLSLDDRYYISMYSRRLPCTLRLRFAIDAFLQQIEITQEEMATYNVRVDPNTLEFSCSDDSYVVEYSEFHADVLQSMREYIQMLDHDKNKDNTLLHRTFSYFRKLL